MTPPVTHTSGSRAGRDVARIHGVAQGDVAEQAQPIKGEARPSAAPHEALAAVVVVGLDTDCRLDVAAVALGGERATLLRLEAPIGFPRPLGVEELFAENTRGT